MPTELERQYFCVIKEPLKRGSLCFRSDDFDIVASTVRRCSFIAKGMYEVVMLGSNPHAIEIYGEYSPYTFVDTQREMLDACFKLTDEYLANGVKPFEPVY